jgi:5,10-methenyltetrahydrofolate synthetase
MQFLGWDGADPSRQDECGIPTSQGQPVVPDVVLVPCVGFTADGFRLGYGGGYFDRTLAGWLPPRPLALGVGFELARLPAFPHAAHDQPLDALITETGVFHPQR